MIIVNSCVGAVTDGKCSPKEVPNHSHGPLPGLCPAGGTTSQSQFEQLSL